MTRKAGLEDFSEEEPLPDPVDRLAAAERRLFGLGSEHAQVLSRMREELWRDVGAPLAEQLASGESR